MPKKGTSGKINKKIKFDRSLVFYYLRLLFPKKNSFKMYYNNMSLPWALACFYQSISFASPIAKHVGSCRWILQASKIVFWGP